MARPENGLQRYIKAVTAYIRDNPSSIGTAGGGIASTTSVLKGDGAGDAVAAVAGTDFAKPSINNNFSVLQTFDAGIRLESSAAIAPTADACAIWSADAFSDGAKLHVRGELGPAVVFGGTFPNITLADTAADTDGESLYIYAPVGGTATAAGKAGGEIELAGGDGSAGGGANSNGGNGGQAGLFGGPGGNATGTGNGGTSGGIHIYGSNGGAGGTGAGANGGAGSEIIIQGSQGGLCQNVSGTSGDGGDITFQMGAAGSVLAGAAGAIGNIQIKSPTGLVIMQWGYNTIPAYGVSVGTTAPITGTNVLKIESGTAWTPIADASAIYVADLSAGNAGFNFVTEVGKSFTIGRLIGSTGYAVLHGPDTPTALNYIISRNLDVTSGMTFLNGSTGIIFQQAGSSFQVSNSRGFSIGAAAEVATGTNVFKIEDGSAWTAAAGSVGIWAADTTGTTNTNAFYFLTEGSGTMGVGISPKYGNYGVFYLGGVGNDGWGDTNYVLMCRNDASTTGILYVNAPINNIEFRVADVAKASIFSNGFNVGTAGLVSGTNVIQIESGSAWTPIADAAAMWVSDFALGDARLNLQSESGFPIIIGNQTITVPNGAADTAGNDVFLRASPGGAHTSNNPRGGFVVLVPGAPGAGGGGGAGMICFRADGGTAETNDYLRVCDTAFSGTFTQAAGSNANVAEFRSQTAGAASGGAGFVGGNVIWTMGAGSAAADGNGGLGGNFAINSGAGGAGVGTNRSGGNAGYSINMNSSNGGAATGTGTGGIGNRIRFVGGTGGTTATGTGGAGGGWDITTGVGGATTGNGTGGAGGGLSWICGAGGQDGGGGGTPGTGGGWVVTAGTGGATVGDAAGGTGGGYSFTCGTGGATVGGTSGDGGGFIVALGASGSGSGGAGGVGGIFTISAGAGGNTTTTFDGGTGSRAVWTFGAGGTTVDGTGGTGGGITATAGAGGAVSGGDGAGGIGGGYDLICGAGGNGVAGGISGDGGGFTLTLGAAGTGASIGGAAGVFTMVAGAGGNSTTTETGGSGSGCYWEFGAGGTTATGTGGRGGGMEVIAGAGGATSGAGTGGAGGGFIYTCGAGGNPTGGGTNGTGGSFVVVPGAIGTGGSGGSVGYFIVRQPGGTPGTDELRIYHDGTDAFYDNPDTNSRHKFGRVLVGDGSSAAPSFAFTSEPGTGFRYLATSEMLWASGGLLKVAFRTNGLRLDGASALAWSNTTNDPTATVDVALSRLAAGVLRLDGSIGSGNAALAISPLDPAQLTGNVDNWNPGTSGLIRFDADAGGYNVTGMVAGQVGEIRILVNDGANSINLTNLDGSSDAANQWSTVSGATIALGAGEVAIAVYGGVAGKWKVGTLAG